jgi:hypothetical protein
MIINQRIADIFRIILRPLSTISRQDPDNPNNYLITLELPSDDSNRINPITFSMPLLRLEPEYEEAIHVSSQRRNAIIPTNQEIMLDSDDDGVGLLHRMNISFDPLEFCVPSNNENREASIEQNSIKVYGLFLSHFSDYLERSYIIEKLLRIFDAVAEKKIAININYVNEDSCLDFLSLTLFHQYVELISALLNLGIIVKEDHVNLGMYKGIGGEYIEMLEAKLIRSTEEDGLEISGNIKE